ncbi:MAG TPA: hypothetical protein PLV92_22910, partial [Pirellulaceae bacterium]|nr:hypothetical protein [Pirellulaceae bacterium]
MTADNSTHYRRYLRRREELGSVIARQLAVLEQADLPRTDGPGPIETLRANAGSVANDDLRVLI